MTISKLYPLRISDSGPVLHVVEIPCIRGTHRLAPAITRPGPDKAAHAERVEWMVANCPSRWGDKIIDHGSFNAYDMSRTNHPYWSCMFFDYADALLFFMKWGHIGEPGQ